MLFILNKPFENLRNEVQKSVQKLSHFTFFIICELPDLVCKCQCGHDLQDKKRWGLGINIHHDNIRNKSSRHEINTKEGNQKINKNTSKCDIQQRQCMICYGIKISPAIPKKFFQDIVFYALKNDLLQKQY